MVKKDTISGIDMMQMAADDPEAGKSTWARLKISSDTVGSLEYGSFLVNIYAHSTNQMTQNVSTNKYFYAPITLLDHKSARSFYNELSRQQEMEFRIELWNDEIKAKVVQWIKENHDSKVNKNFVQVIPFEKLLLSTSSITMQKRFRLQRDWKDCRSEKDVRFKLVCVIDRNDCDDLANQMRNQTNFFSGEFKILLSVESERAQTRQTLIKVESILNGGLAAKLNQQMPKGLQEALVTAEDEQQLLADSATNILMETRDDSDDVSTNFEDKVLKFLQNNLIESSRKIIDKMDDKAWNSVFWNEDNYRPDKASKTMNKVYKKQDAETQKKMVKAIEEANKSSSSQENVKGSSSFENSNSNEKQNRESSTFENATKVDTSVGGKGWGVKLNAAVSVDLTKEGSEDNENRQSSSSSNAQTIGGNRTAVSGSEETSGSVSLSQEEMDKLFDECKNNVEWDGEKFTPKPLTLSRVNLAKLRDTQKFQQRSVRVSYSTAIRTLPVHIADETKLEYINQLIELKNQLEGT